MGAEDGAKGADLVSGRSGGGKVTLLPLTPDNFKGLPEGPLSASQITTFLADNKLSDTKLSDPIVISTTPKQDEQIAANATASKADYEGGKKYNLYSNNSTHNTIGVLNTNTGLDLPVNIGHKSTHHLIKETIMLRGMTPEQRRTYLQKQESYSEKLKADALMNFN